VADVKKGDFSDLLDGTFNMISRTWMTSLVLGGVLFIPTAFLFGWAYGAFMDSIIGLAGGMAGDNPASVLVPFGLGYLWIILAALAQGVVFLFVRACVTEHSARVVRGEPANTFGIASYVIRKKYAPLLGQRVLQMVILSITFFAAMFVAGIFVGIAAALQLTVLAILLGIILGLAGFALVIWLSVRYRVTLESLVIDGTGIEQSIDASMALVRRRWWRVFGYTLLFGLMVSFASSLIATPIMFFSTIRQFIHALEGILRDTSGSQSFNAVFLRLLAGLGRRLGILQYIQSLIACFVTPVFMTLLFLELKKPAQPQPASAEVQLPAETAP
jgi:hypothetical protein